MGTVLNCCALTSHSFDSQFCNIAVTLHNVQELATLSVQLWVLL